MRENVNDIIDVTESIKYLKDHPELLGEDGENNLKRDICKNVIEDISKKKINDVIDVTESVKYLKDHPELLEEDGVSKSCSYTKCNEKQNIDNVDMNNLECQIEMLRKNKQFLMED